MGAFVGEATIFIEDVADVAVAFWAIEVEYCRVTECGAAFLAKGMGPLAAGEEGRQFGAAEVAFFGGGMERWR